MPYTGHEKSHASAPAEAFPQAQEILMVGVGKLVAAGVGVKVGAAVVGVGVGVRVGVGEGTAVLHATSVQVALPTRYTHLL